MRECHGVTLGARLTRSAIRHCVWHPADKWLLGVANHAKHRTLGMTSNALTKRSRGRPFAFDPEQALEVALLLFWQHGFAATSLDMVAEATGVARPSLARVFGDKHSLYLRCLDKFRSRLRTTLGAALARDGSLADALDGFCTAAIDLYVEVRPQPLGCLILNTATSSAADYPDIRNILNETLIELDGALIKRLRKAQAQGELEAGADLSAIAYLAAALVHSLAIRARAGQAPDILRENAKSALLEITRNRG